MKKITTVFIFALMCACAFGQSNEFRASGLYQRAVDLYEGDNYADALRYAGQSREALQGSNQQLQYIYIMIHVKRSDWVNAQKEMERFYSLVEGAEKGVYFPGTTDELTQSEEAALTRIMIEIEEKAAYAVSPEGKREAAEKTLAAQKSEVLSEIASWFYANVADEISDSEEVTFSMIHRVTKQQYWQSGTIRAKVETAISRQGSGFSVRKDVSSYAPVLDDVGKPRNVSLSCSFSVGDVSYAEWIDEQEFFQRVLWEAG